MNVTRIGLDLAKSVFQVHRVDRAGATVVRRRLARSQLLGFFGKLPPCIVGMEACEPPRHHRRPFGLSHAAICCSPSMT